MWALDLVNGGRMRTLVCVCVCVCEREREREREVEWERNGNSAAFCPGDGIFHFCLDRSALCSRASGLPQHCFLKA